MAQASKTHEEKREANKNDRIELTIYMATTPRESLPRGVANKWSADLMAPGSREEGDLRKFLGNPSDPKNKFVLFFETREAAMKYARALDSLLARTGAVSNVLIDVSPTSAKDEEEYTLAPGQNYKISLSADERERVPPLRGREEAVLKKFRVGEEYIAAVVPAKKSAKGDELEGLDLNNPEYNVPVSKDDMAVVPQKKEEKGSARIVENPLRESYMASDGDRVKIFKTAAAREDAWNTLQREGSCTFNVAKRPGRKIDGNPDFLLESMPSNMEGITIKIEKEGNGEYKVTIKGTKKITQEDVIDRLWNRG